MILTPYQKYRFYEIIPGAFLWTTLLGFVFLSFWKPLWMIYFVIAYDLFWFLRVIYFVSYLFISWKKFKKEEKVNWKDQLLRLKDWEKMYHLIFLPTYKDSFEVVRTTLEALKGSNYPLKRYIVVLAGEERDKHNFQMIQKKIQEEYGNIFFRLCFTLHPQNIPGEVAGKGSNIHYAGKKIATLIDELNISHTDVIVSAFDIDTCVHPQYFSYLTFKFLTHPDPYHTSFQPVALYNNNLDESWSFSRVVANSTTFWLLSELSRPERLFTFSSHSMSYTALRDVDFWQSDIVTEDSRIFLQCFIRYDGNYRVEPLYITVSMDNVTGHTLWETVKNQYIQIRRWAWGVEHFPFMLWHFPKAKKIPWQKKIYYLFNLGEGMYSWATGPLLIFLLGRLPLFFADQEVYDLVIAHNLPYILSSLLKLAMIGMGVSALLNIALMPQSTRKRPLWLLKALLQWALLPVTLIIFGALPAIEAQTRLMLGKYLGFNVTHKMRKRSSKILDENAQTVL